MQNKLPKITLITVGKPKSSWAPLVADYSGRLSKVTDFKHVVLKERGEGRDDTRIKTSDEIRKAVPDGSRLVVLDERGTQCSSTELAKQLTAGNRPVCLVIGSSYGVDDPLRAQADICLSLSKMVLPHELARVLLLEQLYRAHAILSNHPYHHS